jgi:hypothetical protein
MHRTGTRLFVMVVMALVEILCAGILMVCAFLRPCAGGDEDDQPMAKAAAISALSLERTVLRNIVSPQS